MENPPFADAFPIGKGAFPLPVYQFQKPQEVRLRRSVYIYIYIYIVPKKDGESLKTSMPYLEYVFSCSKHLKQIQVLESNIVGSEGVLHE